MGVGAHCQAQGCGQVNSYPDRRLGATYQSTPLAVVEIRPTVFSFIGATSRDRVQKLKSAQEAVAEKAFADLDPVWGQGIINSDQWIQIVYLTL